MFNYTVLSRNPSVFRSFTGLQTPEFDALYIKIDEKYDEYQEKRFQRPNRKREIGAGHPFKLDLRDRLLIPFIYHHFYTNSTLLGILFNLGQSNVLKNIRILEPLVKTVLPLPSKIHRRTRRLESIDELEELSRRPQGLPRRPLAGDTPAQGHRKTRNSCSKRSPSHRT